MPVQCVSGVLFWWLVILSWKVLIPAMFIKNEPSTILGVHDRTVYFNTLSLIACTALYISTSPFIIIQNWKKVTWTEHGHYLVLLLRIFAITEMTESAHPTSKTDRLCSIYIFWSEKKFKRKMARKIVSKIYLILPLFIIM